jgi:hypothetical protein
MNPRCKKPRARSERIFPGHARSARARRAGAVGALLGLLAPASLGQQVPIEPVPATAPFVEVDEVGGSWVNLATFPVRPMVYDPSNNLWVVNHHDSTVERFVGLNSTPDKVYGVPWSPVAIAWWNGNGTLPAELLVVCRGTWAVIGLDPATGAPKRLLQLRPGMGLPMGLDARIGRMAEPGDILVDETNDRAFVSCAGADSVLQIDLVANQIVRVFNEEADPVQAPNPPNPRKGWRMKSPGRLSFDFNGVDVLVAPMHSGNNSMATGSLFGGTVVESLDGAAEELPDEDLFRIKPYVDAANPGSVELVLREMGTILFAHALHPLTTDFWQLNTEANNTDPNKQTEPEVKGIFADNRVSIVQNSGTTWGTGPSQILSLDPGGLGGLITTANTVGQPFALAFNSGGFAFIAGLLTDNVVVLDQNGVYNMEINLPDGSIPRGLLPHPTAGTIMLVYLWGLNQVKAYNVNTTTHTANVRATYNLRHDPTPADVAAGRRVFFDAAHSLEQNLSCATCHVEVGNDFLVWNLSNGPLEEKGPMFTQTMVGLKRLAPFHWRGERQLIDFKPAFVGLLGATPDNGNGIPEPGEEPTAADFAAFEDFVFSLNNPANPNQNRERVVDVFIHHPDTTFDGPTEAPTIHGSTLNGNAIDGQDAFQLPFNVNVARHSCVDCHDYPTGTNNDINVEGEGSPVARRISEKPAPFHELWRKRQSLVRATNLHYDPNDPDSPPFVYPAFLGSGLTHMGGIQDLFRFVSLVTDLGADQQANDIADLVHQWDQGLGLAVHFAYLLDAANATSQTTTNELALYLHGEMLKGNCDIAVIGTAKNALGALVPRRWAWDRTAAAYACEDPSAAFPNRSLASFQSGAAGDGEANFFVGLPRGMAERFAIDYDMDGVRNLDPTETAPYDPTVPGWDNGLTPGFASGGSPQILWDTTKVARLVFTTNEPTRATIDYDEPKTPAQQAESPLLSRHHSVLLTGLRPSTDALDAADIDHTVESDYLAESVVYTVTITLTDATNHQVVTTPFTFDTDPFIVPAEVELGIPTSTGALLDGVERKNMRTHVVQEICMGGGDCDNVTFQGGQWRADVDLTIAYKRGEWQIPSGSTRNERVRVKNRMVFGRVMIERADGSRESAFAAGLAVSPVSGAVLVDDVVVEWPAANVSHVGGVPESPTKFLAGTLATDPNGDTSIVFDVNPTSSNGSADDLVTGDRIIFNVEGVVELDTSTAAPHYFITVPPGPIEIHYKTRWRGTFNQWSFPDTMEARAAVRSAPL